MSTLEREVAAVDAPLPSTSMALVPLSGDASRVEGVKLAVAQPTDPGPVLYGMWYTALAMFALAAWASAWGEDASVALGMIGGLLIGLAGLGLLFHVLVGASMAKFRKALGALAALGLTLASILPISRTGAEVYANGRVMALQPLAESLSRDPRIWHLEVQSERMTINGHSGSTNLPQGYYSVEPASLDFDDVFRRDGISRAELEAYGERMRAAGVHGVWQVPGVTVFDVSGSTLLMYVHPGHALPPRNTVLMYTRDNWRSQPLGGGWYRLW